MVAMRRGRGGAIRRRIADASAGRNVLHLQNARRHAYDRLHGSALLGRLSAIEGVARPNEIEMELLAEHQPVGGGEAGAGLRQLRAQAVEGGDLLAVHGVVRIVGAGEMADHQRDVEAPHQPAVGEQVGEVRFAHAEAVETGVDVQSRRRRRRTTGREVSPGACFLEACHDRTQPERRNVARTPGQDAVEQIDRCAGRQRDGRFPFGLRGDEEAPAAGGVERRNDA